MSNLIFDILYSGGGGGGAKVMTDRFFLEDETFLFKILTMYGPLKYLVILKRLFLVLKWW